jgi:GxxExxY protein
MLHEEKTSKIIGAFYTVYNTLGHGLLEKVYENALAIDNTDRTDIHLHWIRENPYSFRVICG